MPAQHDRMTTRTATHRPRRRPLARASAPTPASRGSSTRLRRRDGIVVDAVLDPAEDAEDRRLDGFDGIWIVPGSPYASEDGALAAVRVARERGIPFLGTCGGFQHALLMFARNVCGSPAPRTPSTRRTASSSIVPLACSLVGHEGGDRLAPGSLSERIMGAERSVERYHCAYGLDPAYLDALARARLRFTGHDDAGDVRIAELPGHPFFLATLFQPELSGDGTRAHPVMRAFATACVEQAQRRAAAVAA